MKYLSVTEIAKKWNISERSVRNYCALGKITGAFLTGKTWNIPEDAQKPNRANKKVELPTALLEVLSAEKRAKLSGGIYHKVQIELTYNSNHIEGSRLTHDQTRYIFETNTIGIDGGSVKVDDIVETPNHFKCIDMIITHLYEFHEYSLLNGLKTLSSTPSDIKTNELAANFYETSEFQADQTLLEEINEQFSESLESDVDFEYKGQPQTKTEPVFINGHKSYKRDKKKAINALRKAKFKCEISSEHPTFIRRNSNQNYTEPHHLIPLRFSDDFPVSLDIEENIISLCSNCHNQLHYGRDICPLLEKLYIARKDVLKQAGIDITLEDLFKMYDA